MRKTFMGLVYPYYSKSLPKYLLHYSCLFSLFCFAAGLPTDYEFTCISNILIKMQTPPEGIRKVSLSHFSVNYFIRLLSSKHLVLINQIAI